MKVKLDDIIDATINFKNLNYQDLEQQHMDHLQDDYYCITDVLCIRSLIAILNQLHCKYTTMNLLHLECPNEAHT